MNPDTQKKNAAFSLIELSIVLIVIGIVMGVVLVGRTLINQSQLHKIVASYHQYFMAVRLFKEQYNALPGDYADAFTVWGTSCAADAARCNGNNNDVISYDSGVNPDDDRESMRVWQHLTLSKILPGSYSGVGAIYNSTNTPQIGFLDGEFFIESSPSWNWSQSQNGMMFAAASSGSWNGLLTPNEAQKIDVKVDNGIANTGNLYGITGPNGTSNNSCSGRHGWGGSADYNLLSSQRACYLAWFF